MTKADIAERIKANTDMTLKDSVDMLELVLLSIMKNTLKGHFWGQASKMIS